MECREATLELPKTLQVDYDIPTEVETVHGFLSLDQQGLKQFISEQGLAMDQDDIAFCQAYFKSENREPTITEMQDDRHLLVRPLPPHHLPHHSGPGEV